MISVVLAAAIVLVSTLAFLLIDFERIRAFVQTPRRRQIAKREATRSDVADRLLAEGWPPALVAAVLYTGPLEVTARQYANGSTQVWLRKAS